MESGSDMLHAQCVVRMKCGMEGRPVETKFLEEVNFKLVSKCPDESPQRCLN